MRIEEHRLIREPGTVMVNHQAPISILYWDFLDRCFASLSGVFSRGSPAIIRAHDLHHCGFLALPATRRLRRDCGCRG